MMILVLRWKWKIGERIMTSDVVSSDLSYVVSCNFDSVRHVEPYVGELTAVGHSDLSMDLHGDDVT